MKDQCVRYHRPLARRQRRGNLFLDLDWIRGLCDPQTIGDANHVSVDRESRNSQGVPEHHIGSLAPDTGQLNECFHPGWHQAGMARLECRRDLDESPRLLPKEPGRLYQGFDIADGCTGQLARVAVFLEQARCDLVHTLVGRLGRQDRRDEELERTGEDKFGRCGRVAGPEGTQDFCRAPVCVRHVILPGKPVHRVGTAAHVGRGG